jgi:hypothetical protein
MSYRCSLKSRKIDKALLYLNKNIKNLILYSKYYGWINLILPLNNNNILDLKWNYYDIFHTYTCVCERRFLSKF